jgi:hypothetical protein
MAEVIAERRLYASIAGDETSVTIRLFKPEVLPDNGHYRCEFTFSESDHFPELKNGSGHGIDSVQALTIALSAVGARLDQTNCEWDQFPEQERREDRYKDVREDGFPRPEFSVTHLGTAFRKKMQAIMASEKLEAQKALYRPAGGV